MNFAVVGCGGISRVHLAAVREIEGAAAVAVVDIDEKRARERADEFGIPRVYTDWNDAFGFKDIDAAIICLPHKFHYKAAMDALKAGKHVFIEKPLCIKSEEAKDMVELAGNKNLTLMVGHMKRFDRRFVVMKEKVAEGGIGQVFLAKSEWIGSKEIFTTIPWIVDPAQGGGPMMGYGVHHIDLLQWIAGPVKRVLSYTNNLVWPEAGVEDSAVAIIEFESGAIGTLIYSWGAEISGSYEGLLIHGTMGSLKLENEDLYYTSEKTYGDRTPRLLDTKREDKKDLYVKMFGEEMNITSLEPFVLEIKHFIECVNNKSKPIIDGAEAKRTVDVIVDAYRTAAKFKS